MCWRRASRRHPRRSPGPRTRLQKQATAAACSTAVPMTRQCASRPSSSLDDVDLCREVAGDLEADFLLANGRLGPYLHYCFLLFCSEEHFERDLPSGIEPGGLI